MEFRNVLLIRFSGADYETRIGNGAEDVCVYFGEGGG